MYCKNISPDNVILPRNRHIGKLTPLNYSNTSVDTVSINEIMHVVKTSTINADRTPLGIEKQPPCNTHENQQPLVSSLILPSEIQVHRQVPLSDAKISETTKLALNDLLQNFDPIISKKNNDIGQTDLIEMHIATRLDTTPTAACPYPLALKHHDFLKQEIKNLLDAGIICKSMSPWACPIVVVKKHTPEGSPKQF